MCIEQLHVETLTGLMIAGFIFSGKLISTGELEVNNFFIFSSYDACLPTNKIISDHYWVHTNEPLHLKE